MTNHERGKQRPTYFTIKDKDILWFIPLSSKVDKYKKIIEKKKAKYGDCKTILIRKILDRDHAILLQNAFPTLEKYIDHVHIYKGTPAKVNVAICKEILVNFKYMMSLKSIGNDLFFTDIDKIKEQMLKELQDKVVS